MHRAKTALCAITLTIASLAHITSHAETVEERPSALEMAADAILMRPLMLTTTVLGGAVYIVSLPVSLLGGNAGEAGQKLVVTPFKATFLRCLGCTRKHVPESDYY